MISVIVPIYKVEKYLGKCVESVFAQTYTDFEAIFVDDGTPDQSGVLADEYTLFDTRVITIHKPNGGLSDSRNYGLEIARDDYVTFLDSDDYILPEMLRSMNQLMGNGADICVCGFDRINEDGKITKSVSYQNESMGTEEALELLVQGNVSFIISCAKLYKRKLFKSLRFTIGKIHEDEFLAHHVIGESKKIVSTDETYYQYLFRDDSITGRKKTKVSSFDAVEAFLDRIEFFIKTNRHNFATRMLARTIDTYEKLCNDINIENIHEKFYIKSLRNKLKQLIKVVNKKEAPLPRRIGFIFFFIGDKTYNTWMRLYKGKSHEKNN